jgi:hypothetical protein
VRRLVPVRRARRAAADQEPARVSDGLDDLPDWRITCFFAERGQRGGGVASAALAGAVEEIARLGGGTIESYPDDVDGRSVSASFLHNGTVAMFERQGFERTRRIGKTRWVVRKSLGSPAADAGRRSDTRSVASEARRRLQGTRWS